MMTRQGIKIISIITAIPVILCILIYFLTAGASVPKTVEQDPSLPHVTINNITFHAETHGDPDNPVVIVVHGVFRRVL
jgi:proline iminopeptidase